MPTDRAHTIEIYGKGKMTVGRAVWHLLGKKVAPRCVVYRTCDSYDCANPDHFASGQRKSLTRHLAERGLPMSPARLAPLAESRNRRTKLTPELRCWAFESAQSGPEVGHALDCAAGSVNRVRREQARRPAASIFQLADFAAVEKLRLAA